MVFFYFLPMLIAIGFLLARVARGGSLKVRPGGAPVLMGFSRSPRSESSGRCLPGMLR